jgi:hypothetical protein
MKASPLTVFLTIAIIVIVGTSLCALPMPSAPPLQGSFSVVQKASSTTENVFFGSFSEDMRPQEIKIFIFMIENLSSTGRAAYTMPMTGLSGPLDIDPSQSYNMSGICGVRYTDLTQDEKISDGDYITITFVHSGSGSVQYQVAMMHLETGDAIDSITFNW